MKRLIASAIVGMLVCAVPVGTCEAGCPAGSISSVGPTGESFIWTSSVFKPSFYLFYPPAMYGPAAVPPVTGNLQGVFWSLGQGDPSPGAGIDSGTYDWTASGGVSWDSYPANPAHDALYYAALLDADWNGPGVDGCPPADACTCVLMTDHDGATGYFALVSALSDATGDTFVNQGGFDAAGNELPIVLLRIPQAEIKQIDEDPVTLDLQLTVIGHPPYRGIYAQDDCACGPTGYQIYVQVLEAPSSPPSPDLLAGWSLASLASGGAQQINVPGDPIVIDVACGAQDSDVYIGTRYHFDSGFATPVVSGGRQRVRCGPNAGSDPGSPEGFRPGRPSAKPDTLGRGTGRR